MIQGKSRTMAYCGFLARAVVEGLKAGCFVVDRPEEHSWYGGIGISFATEIETLELFLNKRWVRKVANLQAGNDIEDPDPQLVIQYINGKFKVYLECLIGEYNDGSRKPKRETFTEDRVIALLTKMIEDKHAIYDQDGRSIFPPFKYIV